jgi:heat shock protein HslJ
VLASGIPLPQDLKVTRPSATFERGTVGGSTGCNRYTAGYTVDGDSLKLGRIAQTQMACAPPADAIEHAYVGALVKVRGWKSDGGELVLVGADDAELLRYRAATPRGSWQVTAFLRGDAVVSTLAGTTLSATFGADGALSGSAGCNTYKATYRTDKGRIEIGPPAATRMICTAPTGVMEQETAYLSVLPTAVGYRVDGHSLELLSADGTLVATYTRLTAR